MALSNWDTMAVDLEGKAINGIFVSPLGVRVEIYKNWVYLRDEKSWREGGRFCKDTVMEIISGDLSYLDVTIKAIRGPQEGVYVACWSVVRGETEGKWNGMIGCGVSGYSNDKWIGVTKESKKFLQDWISATQVMFDEAEIEAFYKSLPDQTPNKEEIIAGMLKPSFVFPEQIAKVRLDGALRFNQGDAYFADRLEFEIPATKVGEANPSVLSGIIKQKEN